MVLIAIEAKIFAKKLRYSSICSSKKMIVVVSVVGIFNLLGVWGTYGWGPYRLARMGYVGGS